MDCCLWKTDCSVRVNQVGMREACGFGRAAVGVVAAL